MTYKASYVSINDEGSESKCTRFVNKTWKRISCDVPGYCTVNQQTPVHMFETLHGLYGEPSFCCPSDPENGVVGFAEWNFQTDGHRVNQITVRDEFVYNDLPVKHVDLVTSRIKLDVYDHSAKSMLNTMSDGVRVDTLQHQLYVRADDLDRTNAMISAAFQANAPNREFVDKPADLFDHFVTQQPSTCYLPDDVNRRVVCKQKLQVLRVTDSPTTRDRHYDQNATNSETNQADTKRPAAPATTASGSSGSRYGDQS